MGQHYGCFKAYDVRGAVPDDLNEDLAYRIGRSFADETGAKRVAVGHDIRLSGPLLSDALTRGFLDAGVDVTDIGLVGTEMVYFAVSSLGLEGGVMTTASHNPAGDNGFKMVRSESRPISSDSGLAEIERRAFEGKWERSGAGTCKEYDIYDPYVEYLLRFCDSGSLKPLKVLAKAGNGAAGLTMRRLASRLPIEVTKMQFEPDGTFPNGVPNPMIEDNRKDAEHILRGGGYDLGVAWDGDYDRCFFFDGRGRFIEGYYVVGLLAEALLKKHPGATIVYDPRLVWNTLDLIERNGGRGVMCKSGHAFIKEKMRAVDAVYGGEMSAHHYFRDYWYCDSGMAPLLLVLQLVSESGLSLAELVEGMMEKYPCSGEINCRVGDAQGALARVEDQFGGGIVDRTDGLSVAFPDWRFNLRSSNTEPVMRLNVESRGNADLVREMTDRLLALVRG